MAFEIMRSITLPVGGAISALRFVTINASGQAAAASAVTSDVVGITLEGVTAEEFTAGKVVIPIGVPDGGKTEVEVSEAIAAGNPIGPATDGRARHADTVGNRIIGYALTSAAAAGERITMIFLKAGNTV
ncbi:MAG: hypothetical protein K0U41_02275 [Gammaproteobacteria bacterium]|nr:hypothetical protein [Gammaproteobacteria bacterium]